MQPKAPTDIEGLDLSSYQGITNATDLFTDYPHYIYFRARGSAATADPTLNSRVEMARNFGVPSGAYYFGTPKAFPTDAEAIAHAQSQAQDFINILAGAYGAGRVGDLVPMLDIEEYKDTVTGVAGYPKASGMTSAQLLIWIKAFRDYFFTKTNRRLGFYSNRYFLTDPTQIGFTTAQLTQINDMPLWLAEYDQYYGGAAGNVQPANLGGWDKYVLWQYAVLPDADEHGLTHVTNEVDHNRTKSVDWIRPPRPVKDFRVKDLGAGTIEVTITKPDDVDYIGTSVYINNTWKKWISPAETKTTITGQPLGEPIIVQVMTEDLYHDTTPAPTPIEITLTEAGGFVAMPMQRGISTNTANRMLINEGVVYLNYKTTGERLLGATRGGTEFTIEQEIRTPEIDGAKGPVKGTRRVVESIAKISTELLEITRENVMLALVGADSTTGGTAPDTYNVVRRTREIGSTDYLTNVAVVGELADGKQVVIVLYNALNDEGVTIGQEDRDEATLPISFTAHYDPATMNQEPWEIRFPTTAL